MTDDTKGLEKFMADVIANDPEREPHLEYQSLSDMAREVDPVKNRIQSEREWLLSALGPTTQYFLKAVIESGLKTLDALLFAVEQHESDSSGNCINCVEGRDSECVPFPCTEYKGIAERLGVEL